MRDKLKVKTLIFYQCPICKKQYKKKSEAQACLDIGMEKQVVFVGDIVEVGAGYGWYDGDKRWVMNPEVNLNKIKSHGNCFEKCCTYSFYYIVTKVNLDPSHPHKWRYHVFTKAMTGKQGHRGGQTYFETHYTPKKIKNPPKFVIGDSKDLIGKAAEFLL